MAGILIHRLEEHGDLEGAWGEIFTDADETMVAALIEAREALRRARSDEDISAEDIAALLQLEERFRTRYAEDDQALAQVADIAATVAAIAIGIVVTAATGGAGAPAAAALIASMGAGAVGGAVARAGAHALLRGEHVSSAELGEQALVGGVEGAVAVLSGNLAGRIVRLSGLAGSGVAQAATRSVGVVSENALAAGAARTAGQRVLAAGVEGAIDGFISGVVGEAVYTAMDEHAWRRGISRCDGRFPTCLHIYGDESDEDSCRLLEHSGRLGAQATSRCRSLPPRWNVSVQESVSLGTHSTR